MKRILVPALAFTVVATGAACGSEDSADPPPPTTTSPTAADEEALRDLAEGWFEASRRIGIDGESPSLADQYLTAEYLTGFKDEIARRDSAGEAVVGDPQGRSSNFVESIEVSGDEAQIVQCIVDADVLIRAADGSSLDDSVSAKRFESQAVETPSGWRFTSRSTVDEWEDQTECD
ncbi:MAG: hypothetical protein ACR2JF_07480 [Iamia sp.]